MTTDIGMRWRPDGPVRYRVDAATGRRIGILPATCKRGVHSLAEVGYTAIVRDGHLVVRCSVCADIPTPDHSWTLTTTEPPPDTAELDNRPYAGIDPHFVTRPVQRAQNAGSPYKDRLARGPGL